MFVFKQEEYMVPKPMLESNPPTLMRYFYDKQALTRGDIENAGGHFGKSRTIPQQFMLVATHFKKNTQTPLSF